MSQIATWRNSNIAPRAFQDGEEEMDSIVSTAVGSTARGIMWEAKQARAMLQSLLIIVSGWALLQKGQTWPGQVPAQNFHLEPTSQGSGRAAA